MLRFRIASAIASAAVLTACYNGPSSNAPGADEVSKLPPGVVYHKEGDPADVGMVTGLYPGDNPGDPLCCWLGPDATFQARVPPKARKIMLTVLVPDLEVLRGRTQGISVTVDSGNAKSFSPLPVGIRTLVVPIVPQQQEHVAVIELRAAYSFVPKEVGLNGDTRSLSMYLKRVKAQ